MSEQTNPLDTPGVPFEVELLNPNPTSSRRKGVPVYRISFEVPEKVHSAFMSARESNLRLVGYMSVLPDTDEQPAHNALAKKAPKAKEPKGPYSQLWRHLYLAGFIHAPGVKETIAEHRITDTEPEWEILHRVFGVGGASLAAISPDEIYAKFPPNEYPQVGTMVEQAIKKAERQQPKTPPDQNGATKSVYEDGGNDF